MGGQTGIFDQTEMTVFDGFYSPFVIRRKTQNLYNYRIQLYLECTLAKRLLHMVHITCRPIFSQKEQATKVIPHICHEVTTIAHSNSTVE